MAGSTPTAPTAAVSSANVHSSNGRTPEKPVPKLAVIPVSAACRKDSPCRWTVTVGEVLAWWIYAIFFLNLPGEQWTGNSNVAWRAGLAAEAAPSFAANWTLLRQSYVKLEISPQQSPCMPVRRLLLSSLVVKHFQRWWVCPTTGPRAVTLWLTMSTGSQVLNMD